MLSDSEYLWAQPEFQMLMLIRISMFNVHNSSQSLSVRDTRRECATRKNLISTELSKMKDIFPPHNSANSNVEAQGDQGLEEFSSIDFRA